MTTPGSALLFRSLCAPTGDLPAPAPLSTQPGDQRTAMMPLRTRTRAQHRASRIATERNHNRMARLGAYVVETGAGPPDPTDEEPPPF